MAGAWVCLAVAGLCIVVAGICVNLDRRAAEQVVARRDREAIERAAELDLMKRKLEAEEYLLRRLRDFANAPRGAIPPGNAGAGAQP